VKFERDGLTPETETFCVYCQRDYKTPQKLKTHVLKIHTATHRAAAYMNEDKKKGISHG
jgi:hypothetical protein